MLKDRYGRDFYFSSDFIETVSGHYFVDKSLLIRDFIDSHAEVSLIIRPRRFGKSLNMDMMKTFFEKTGEDTSVYFKNLKIWQCGDKYTSEQGRYPVIHLDFKEVTCDTFDESLDKIESRLSSEFSRHTELEASPLIDRRTDLPIYNRIVDRTASRNDAEDALLTLTKMLHAHYGVKPIILIDEYEVPIRSAYEEGYYSEMVKFIRNFLSAGLKGNGHLNFAVLTGITKILKEDVSPGLGNLCVDSVTVQRYSEYYGFTKDDVKAILEDFGAEDKFDEICDWYEGYHFGNTEIFNPWSISGYVNGNFTPGTYWADTSVNSIVGDFLKSSSGTDGKMLNDLLVHVPVMATINEDMTCGGLYKETGEGKRSDIYGIMLATGYLTFAGDEKASGLVVPNKEIKGIYEKEILSYLWGERGPDIGGDIRLAFVTGNAKILGRALQEVRDAMAEGFDFIKENTYNAFVAGLNASVSYNYKVCSKEESGPGRLCLSFEPRNLSDISGVILEIESAARVKNIEKKAEEAFRQIDKMRLPAKLKDAGVKEIDEYAVVFFGKKVSVVKREERDV